MYKFCAFVYDFLHMYIYCMHVIFVFCLCVLMPGLAVFLPILINILLWNAMNFSEMLGCLLLCKQQ